jgi:CheY-like chemotaxis protein
MHKVVKMTGPLINKFLLVVDDDPGMLRALEKVLHGEGATVTCLARADDAIELLTRRQNRFDLIITDLKMPFVTGATFVYAVNQVFPDLPIIVLTAFGSPDVKAACEEHGAVAFLEKPVDTAQLIAAIALTLAPPQAKLKADKPAAE